MQFKERSGKVLCIRSIKGKESTVASQKIGNYTIARETEEALDRDEYNQLKTWLHNHKQAAKEARLKSSLSVAPTILRETAEALDWLDDSAQPDDKQVEKILDGLDELKRALRAKGIKITRQTKKKSDVKDDKTGELSL